MEIKLNSHSQPNVGQYTVERANDDQFYINWRSSHKLAHGIVVRCGALPPLQSLFEQAGYKQASEPNVENDEFQCEACKRVCDIEDSIKFQDEYLCTFCGEDVLKNRNKELVANETDSVCERDY